MLHLRQNPLITVLSLYMLDPKPLDTWNTNGVNLDKVTISNMMHGKTGGHGAGQKEGNVKIFLEKCIRKLAPECNLCKN